MSIRNLEEELEAHRRTTTLPTDAVARKALPIVAGVLDYFPDALLAVAAVSVAGNDQHNAGEPLHHARGKSMDHADSLVRHLMERGTLDSDGLRHSAKVAWRALALLQEELEADGAPMARGARLVPPDPPPLQDPRIAARELRMLGKEYDVWG